MKSYVLVREDDGSESVELPCEESGELLLSTLAAQFPGASGLKYCAENSVVRGVRLVEDRLHPPDDGWGSKIFKVVVNREAKRKRDENDEDEEEYSPRKIHEPKTKDLIVLGLAWKTSQEQMRQYFEKFGEVVMTVVKRHPKTNQSKGFGFVRFAKFSDQIKVVSQRHFIDGRWCDVKIPNSNEATSQSQACKVFVGRLTEDITALDLREHFEYFGRVTDVFIPQPFRKFAFVTFASPFVASQVVWAEEHVIKERPVNVCEASPDKHGMRRNNGGGSLGGCVNRPVIGNSSTSMGNNMSYSQGNDNWVNPKCEQTDWWSNEQMNRQRMNEWNSYNTNTFDDY